MQMLTTVPFAGFYESWHSWNIDDAENSAVQNDSGEPMFSLFEHVNLDYREIERKYSSAYVSNLSDEFGVPLEFESLSSPREYNFETDQIFAHIDSRRAYLLFRKVRADGSLDEYARRRFTHRDGFHSWYRPEWREWGPFREWDHNQIGTVLAAYVGSDSSEFRDWESMSSMEYEQCNGCLDNWIWEAMGEDDCKRIGKVVDYLRRREERKWRSAA